MEFELGGSLRWRSPEPSLSPDSKPAGAAAPPATSAIPSAAGGEAGEPSPLRGIVEYLSFAAKRDPVSLEGRIKWDETAVLTADGGADPERSAWRNYLQLDATLTGKDFTWRDFSVHSSNSSVRIQNGNLHFHPYQIETTDGSIESRGVYELGKNRLRIESLRLTADPFITLDRFGFPMSELEAWIDFERRPTITGENMIVDLGDPAASSGLLRKDGPVGFALNLPGGRSLLVEEPRGSLRFGGGVIQTEDMTARILGGNTQVRLSISPFGEMISYAFAVELDEVPVETASDWLEPGNRFDEEGTVDLSFDGKGVDTLESVVGRGRAHIGAENASAQHFPLLRGLLGFIDGGYQKDWTLDLPFTVRDGKIETAAGRLSGHRVSVNLTGSLDWINDQVDVYAGVNLRGLFGVVTSIASPLRSDFIEIVGKGTISDVEWETKREMERHERQQARRSR